MDIIELMTQLVSISSVFPKEQRVAEFIEDFLKRNEFITERVLTSRNRFNIVATSSPSSHFVGFYGHMDTVPPDVHYAHNPFKVESDAKRAHGLGVADMKGGIAACLLAGVWGKQNGVPVKLVFGVDEENISQGAHDLVSSGKLSDIDCMIVAESGQAADLKEPFSVCYGRKGRVLYELVVSGKTAHAAESSIAVNAIEQMALCVEFLSIYSFLAHTQLGKTVIVIHSVHGASDSFSVPDSCRLQFSVLTTPNADLPLFEKSFAEFCKGNNIVYDLHLVSRPTPYASSYEVDRDNEFVQQIESIFNKHGVEPRYTSSVADENVFAHRLGIPVVTVGPIGGGDHTKNEWVDLQSLRMIEEVYREIMRTFKMSIKS